MSDETVENIILAIIAFLFPPVVVAIKKGLNGHFFLNLFLTFFGFWVFGIAHALYTIFHKDKEV